MAKESDIPIITIDGPSGSGKGTVSRAVAAALGWHLLDSGALYRLVALAAMRNRIDPADRGAHARIAEGMRVRFGADASGQERVWLEGNDVTSELRTEQAGEAASRVAAIPEVRTALLDRQRRFAERPGLVADGRDMGSVIFPGAALKIFLTASPDERARRRHKQLKQKGLDVSLPALSREIAQRDARDTGREAAPLRAADDAVHLDSTGLDIDEVVARILRLARERFGAAAPRRDG
jgi:cytidylate kinase